MKKAIEKIRQKSFMNTLKTICIILILIAIFIGINFLVKKLDVQDIDLTESKLYTLSEDSINQIEKIDKNILIYFFGFENNDKIIDLAKQYTKANTNIIVQTEDVTQRPDLKEKFGIEDGNIAIVIESEGKNKLLTTEDLYTYDYSTYEEIDLTEQKITNAILDVTADEKPVIYFLKGHGEYSLESHLTILSLYLQNEVNEVKSLDLLVTNKVPEDISLLVICSPTQDFKDFETELIMEYINNGGKILFLNDSNFKEELVNVQKILDVFGISFDNKGILFEEDSSKMVMQTPNLIIPSISYTDITKDIITDGGVALLNSSKINFKDEKIEEFELTVERIITSNETSVYENDFNNISNQNIINEEKEKFTIGALINKQIDDERKSTLIAYANNAFATDYKITIGNQDIPCIYLYNNKDLILNSISYLTNKNDRITVRKNSGTVSYTVTQAQDRIIRTVIFAFPILIIIFGIFIWQIRRRKK